MMIFGWNDIKIYPQPVGTGFAPSLRSHKFFRSIAFTQKQTPSCEGVCCVLIFNSTLKLNKLKHTFICHIVNYLCNFGSACVAYGIDITCITYYAIFNRPSNSCFCPRTCISAVGICLYNCINVARSFTVKVSAEDKTNLLSWYVCADAEIIRWISVLFLRMIEL